MKRGVLWALLAAGAVWLGLVACVPRAGQTKVWFRQGREYMSDYFMPRNTAGHANPYREPAHTLEFAYVRGGEVKAGPGWDLEERDRAYPAGALAPLVAFAESLDGARACNAVMIGVFVLVVCLCLVFSRLVPGPAVLLPLLLSGPLLFAYERGNPVWLAAAGLAVFLLFWDHPCRGVRWLAAFGLAVAASVKVMPAVLGALYLAPIVRRTRGALADALVCLGLGVLVFALPWLLVGGPESFPDWWRTGHENVSWYAPRTVFGCVGIYRTAMIALHRAWEMTAGAQVARIASVVLGTLALAAGVWKVGRSRYASVLLVTGGMMMLGANMQFYTTLYLLPAFFLWLSERRRLAVPEGLAWFVVWNPLQVPFGAVQLYPVVNVAFLALLCLAAFGDNVRGGDGAEI